MVRILNLFPFLSRRGASEWQRAEEERSQFLAQEQAARNQLEAGSGVTRALQVLTESALITTGSEDLLRKLLECIHKLLAVDTACIALLDEESQTLVPRSAIGLDTELLREVQIPLGEGFAGRIMAERRSIIVDELKRVESLNPALAARHVHSLLGAPLLVEGRAIGVIHVGTVHARRFTEDDARVLHLCADRAAMAIEHVRLMEAEHRARADAEKLTAEHVAILGQIADGVVLADAAGRITFANTAAQSRYGITSLGADIEHLADACSISTADGQQCVPAETPLARAVVLGETVVGADLCIRRPDGADMPVLISATPVLGEDDSKLGAVMTIHDMTAQRAVERQKDEFFANVSHDLRTPLAAIMSSIGVVLANEPPGVPDPLHRLLLNIDLAADRMAELVDNLLELTRLQAGRVQLRCECCDLRDLATRAASAIEPLARAQAQHVELDLPAEPVLAEVDRERLERAILNLLSNAHKYGPSGGRIQLRLERREDEAVLSVADEGPGIPDEEQQRIFERFYQLGTGATRERRGSGLGLPIARAMIELHGGRIAVQSKPGAGSIFSLVIPMAGPADTPPMTEVA